MTGTTGVVSRAYSEESRLRVRGSLLDALGSSLDHGGQNLSTAVSILARVIDEDTWRDYILSDGRKIHWDSFEEFVTAKPRRGLSVDVALVKRVVADDPRLRDKLAQLLDNHLGHNNVTTQRNSSGNAKDTALRRLRKDSPELHTRVLAGELTAHAAMVLGGFRHPTITVRADSPWERCAHCSIAIPVINWWRQSVPWRRTDMARSEEETHKYRWMIAVDYSDLPASVRSVAIIYGRYSKGDRVYLYTAHLQQVTGRSKDTINRATQALVSAGWLSVLERPGLGEHRAVSYRTTIPDKRYDSRTAHHAGRHATEAVKRSDGRTASPVDNSHKRYDSRTGDVSDGASDRYDHRTPGVRPSDTKGEVKGELKVEARERATPPPTRYCEKHPDGYDGPCRPCGTARERYAEWDQARRSRPAVVLGACDTCGSADGAPRSERTIETDSGRCGPCPSCRPDDAAEAQRARLRAGVQQIGTSV